MRAIRFPSGILSGLCALALVAGCGDDSSGDDDDDDDDDDVVIDASTDIDGNTGIDASPGALPPGGFMELVVLDTFRYGYAELWSDVVLVEGAGDVYFPAEPATEDSFEIFDPPGGEPEPDAGVPVDAGLQDAAPFPENEITYFDAGPSLFSFFNKEMFTYNQDPENLSYEMDFIEGQETPTEPGWASFLIPAAAPVPERAYNEVLSIAPVVITAPDVTAIPDPATDIDVTWTEAPAAAAVGVFVFSIDADENFHFNCEGDVVNDGAFTIPAACIDPTAMFVSIGLDTTLQTDVEYNGRRLLLEGRYQTQVDLAPPEPPAAMAQRHAALSACLASVRAQAKRGPDRRNAMLAGAAQCVAKH